MASTRVICDCPNIPRATDENLVLSCQWRNLINPGKTPSWHELWSCCSAAWSTRSCGPCPPQTPTPCLTSGWHWWRAFHSPAGVSCPLWQPSLQSTGLLDAGLLRVVGLAQSNRFRFGAAMPIPILFQC